MPTTTKTKYRLQPVAYRLNSSEPLVHTFYTLRFPKACLEVFNRLNQMLPSVQGVERRNLPIASLNAAILALYPEVMRVEKNATYEGKGWITADRVIDSEHLRQVILSWLRVHFEKLATSPIFSEAEGLVGVQSWEWEATSINFGNYCRCSNGTVLLEGAYFEAVPNHIVQKLSSRDVQLSFSNERRNLYRCGPNELVSWPPFEYVERGETFYYSLALEFSAQTMPNEPAPLVVMEVKTRRYVSGSLYKDKAINLSADHDTRVLLHLPAYWQERGNVQSFTNAHLTLKFQGEIKEASWSDHVGKILSGLTWQARLPEATSLLSEPGQYIQGHQGTIAAILYSNDMNGWKHAVGTGSSIVDKHSLMQQVSQIIPQLTPWESVTRARKAFNVNLQGLSWSKTPIEQRRTALRDIVGEDLCIEIHYESEKVRLALRNKIIDILGLTEIPESGATFRTPQINVLLKEISIGTIGSRLVMDKRTRKEVSAAIALRVEEVNQKLAKALIPTGSLIELPGKNAWFRKEDPKLALRKGLAKTGRVSQFIEPDTETASSKRSKKESDLDHRAESAVLDLLRQFGYLPDSIDFLTAGRGKKSKELEPNPLHIFAFWLVRTNQRVQRGSNLLPVALYMHTANNKVMIRFPGSNGWRSYYDALLELGRFDLHGNTKQTKPSIQGFVHKLWQDEIIPSGNALILVDGPNFRSNWPWLTDKNINASRLWVEGPNMGWDYSELKGVRLVRVRTGNEVPQGYGLGDEGEVSFTSGVFPVSQQVFWGMAPKPKTMMKVKNEVARTKRTDCPSHVHRQPGIVEIVPAILQPEDDPAMWATLVQKMRQMMPSYDDYTLRPLPLHLLELVEEYVNAIQTV